MSNITPHSPLSRPNRCGSDMEEVLNLYVDGELPAEKQPELFTHLATCSSCRHTLDSIMRFRRIGRQEYMVVPPSVDDAFLKRLGQHKSPAKRINRVIDRDPIWHMRTKVSVRTAVMAALVLFIAGLLLPLNSQKATAISYVAGHEERIDFIEQVRPREAVYVFYPGLIVEATKTDELSLPESL